MSGLTRHETFRQAVEILVQREVNNARPANPGAYAGSVRSRLLNDKRDLARGLMEDELPTPEQLAEALDDTPDTPPPAPTVRYHSDKDTCPNCGCYGGGGWGLAPDRCEDAGTIPDLVPCPVCAVDRHRLHARAHVVEDRAHLHETVALAIKAQREARS